MTGHGRAVIIAATVAALSITAEAAAQTARADAWKRLPPAPTTCFLDDGFVDKGNRTLSEIAAEMTRQDEINASTRKKFDAMDMMERMQKMQAIMMKDPQKGAKMIEATQQVAQTNTTAMLESNEAVKGLDAVFAREKTSWKAEADKAKAPAQARIKQLVETRTKPYGEAGGVKWLTQADYTNYVGLVGEMNAAYEKACLAFFGASGSFPKYLARYKSEVSERMIDVAEAHEDALTSQMSIMDTPAGGYRSTAPLSYVHAYLLRVVEVYGLRQWKSKIDIPWP